MPDGGSLTIAVITLVKVAVCPPGATLVITIVVLVITAELPAVDELESGDMVAAGVLVNGLDNTAEPGAWLVVWSSSEEGVEAELDVMLTLGGTEVRLDGVTDGKDGSSEIED